MTKIIKCLRDALNDLKTFSTLNVIVFKLWTKWIFSVFPSDDYSVSLSVWMISFSAVKWFSHFVFIAYIIGLASICVCAGTSSHLSTESSTRNELWTQRRKCITNTQKPLELFSSNNFQFNNLFIAEWLAVISTAKRLLTLWSGSQWTLKSWKWIQCIN